MTGVSVVICCYNSSKRLPKTLDHLKAQEIPPQIKWEVIIVDNASLDNTSEFAKEYWGNHPVPLRIVHEPKAGLSNARITGINSSNYDFVSLVDDDNWVENHWIEKTFNILNNNKNVALCGGRGIAAFESDEPEWFKRYRKAYATGPQHSETGILPERKAFLYGAGMGIRKEVFQNLLRSGFKFWLSDRSGKKLTSGGDFELCLVMSLLGYKLYYDDNMTFYHYMPTGRLTWDYLVNLTRGFARSSAVTQLYQMEVYKYKGFERLKYQNYFLSILMSLNRVFWSAMKLTPHLFTDKTGNQKYYKYIYNMHSLLSKLSFYSRHKKLIADLEHGNWKKVALALTQEETQIAL